MSHFSQHRADSSCAPTPPAGCCRRAGHTLIEILLALGLSLVILVAAYAALDQHWRYAEAGQRQTERMQVTRALFERMSLDVRSVVFLRDAARSARTGNARRSTAAGDPAAALGIVGDGQKLVLQVAVPRNARPVGGHTIRWEMHASTAPAAGQTTFGLARIVRPAKSSDGDKTLSPKDLLAGEVETIRFRYFARGNWLDRWDSVEQQALPRAVEITIGFRNASAAQQTTGDPTNPGEYRLIVPVPASEART